MKNVPHALLAAAVLSSLQANAAGFQVAETSASGLGRAFSGEAAVADNASVLARNPAALTRFKQASVSAGINFVQPEIDVADMTTMQQADDIAPSALIPNAYYAAPINDKWSWGVGLFTVYGVATDYSDNLNAGDLAGDTSLMSVNLNPSVAYRINDQWSIGGGLNLIYAEAELNRHWGALSAISPLLSPEDKLLGLKGDTWAWGWNAGLMYEINESHRFGFGYRAEVALDFDDGDFTDTNGSKKKAQLDMDLPAIWEFSGFHQLTDVVALHYSYVRTQWSTFKELKATSNQCTTGGPGICFEKKENYDDSARWSLGSTLTLNEQWVARVGVALDEQAGEPTLGIPDADRFWYSVGLGYQPNAEWAFDLGFTYVDSDTNRFNELSQAGNYQFEAKGYAYIVGLQASYQF